MLKESIICEYCLKELICDTKDPHVFALKLTNIDVNRNSSAIEFLTYVFPPLGSDKHFCDLNCLNKWLNKGDN